MATITFDITKYNPATMGQTDLMNSIKLLQSFLTARPGLSVGQILLYPIPGNATITATVTLTSSEQSALQTLITNSIAQAHANLSSGNF